MNWKGYFKKEGGIYLIKKYWQTNALFICLLNFLFLGRNKKALEILRLCADYKVNRKLRKIYEPVIERWSRKEAMEYPYGDSILSSKKVWICWWQGIENAPDIVKLCYKSVCDNLGGWEINVITFENYSTYVSFPKFIIEKVDAKKISLTHFSDLLRIALLDKYGGLWLDSTVLVTSGEFPKSIINSDLFLFQTLKPGADGNTSLISSWLIYSKPHNILLCKTLELLYFYWSKYDCIIDYFILHHTFSIVSEIFDVEHDKIPQFSNSIPHILLLNIFNEYDETYWADLKQMTPFHKLSYKLDFENKPKELFTYYDYLMNQYEE